MYSCVLQTHFLEKSLLGKNDQKWSKMAKNRVLDFLRESHL